MDMVAIGGSGAASMVLILFADDVDDAAIFLQIRSLFCCALECVQENDSMVLLVRYHRPGSGRPKSKTCSARTLGSPINSHKVSW